MFWGPVRGSHLSSPASLTVMLIVKSNAKRSAAGVVIGPRSRWRHASLTGQIELHNGLPLELEELPLQISNCGDLLVGFPRRTVSDNIHCCSAGTNSRCPASLTVSCGADESEVV
jgi:hypothetical protein